MSCPAARQPLASTSAPAVSSSSVVPAQSALARRFLAVSSLQLLSYTANVGALTILAADDGAPRRFLPPLLGAHLLACGLCVGAAWLEVRGRLPGVRGLLVAPLALLFLGGAQLVHIWLAWQDLVAEAHPHGSFASQADGRLSARGCASAREALREDRETRGRCRCALAPKAPAAYAAAARLRPRFHCRGVDAVLEGAAFSGVLLYILCAVPSTRLAAASWHSRWLPEGTARGVLWTSGGLSLLSAVLALLEVDRTASGGASCDSKLRALLLPLLRVSEVASRLWLLGLLVALPAAAGLPTVPTVLGLPAVLVLDYIVTACLLASTDSCQGLLGPFIALPAMVADLSRCADQAGCSRAAGQRFTRRLAWKNTAELSAVMGLSLLIVLGGAGDNGWASDGPSFGDASRALARLSAALEPRRLLSLAGASFLILYYVLSFCIGCGEASRPPNADDLCRAAGRGNAAALAVLLGRGAADAGDAEMMVARVNLAGRDGYSALHVAVRAGASHAAALLLNAGADPALRASTRYGETPVILAAAGGHDDILRRLLRLGGVRALHEGIAAAPAAAPAAAVSAETAALTVEEGDAALHLALRRGHTLCVHTLLQVRADLGSRNALGKSASEVAYSAASARPRGGSDSLQVLLTLFPAASDGVRCCAAVNMGAAGDAAEGSSRVGSSRGGSDGIVVVATRSGVREDGVVSPGSSSSSSPPPSRRHSSAGSCSSGSGDEGRVTAAAASGSAARVDLEADIVWMQLSSGTALETLLAEARGAAAAATPSVPSALGATDASSATSSAWHSRSSGARRPRLLAAEAVVSAQLPLPLLVALAGPGALRRLLMPTKRATLHDGTPPRDARHSHCSAALGFEAFRILGVAGEGNFGVVYEATDTQSAATCGVEARRYALKVLRRRQYRLQPMLERAWQERNVLKAARHPFIVRLMGAFRTPVHELALVMEFCPNGNLNDFIVTHGSPGLPLLLTRRLLAEMLLALEYLHDVLYVVFRDLKPENILMDVSFHAKLTDFGLAKFNSTSGTHSFVGSTYYVAPEVAPSGLEVYGAAVDLYALGLVAWVCFTGGFAVRIGSSVVAAAPRGVVPGWPSAADAAASGANLAGGSSKGGGSRGGSSRSGSIAGASCDVQSGSDGGGGGDFGGGGSREVRVPPATRGHLLDWLETQRRAPQPSGASAAPPPPPPPLGLQPLKAPLSAAALAFVEHLTAAHPRERGTARQLRAHPFFASSSLAPPLATMQDWDALLPLERGDGDGGSSARLSTISSVDSWTLQLREP